MMKTVMRTVAFAKDAIAEYAPLIIESLSTVLGAVCANPTNPTFNHYLFETMAAVIRFVGGARPDTVAALDGMLMPSVEVSLGMGAAATAGAVPAAVARIQLPHCNPSRLPPRRRCC